MKERSYPIPLTKYLKKLCHLLCLSILFMVPMIYPFKIDDEILRKVVPWLTERGAFGKSLWDWQLEPYFFFGLSPLLLKWSVAGSYVLFLAGAFILWKLSLPAKRGEKRLTVAYILIFLMIIYVGISTLFVSPTFYKSASAFLFFLLAIGYFVIFADLDKSSSFIFKSFFLIGIASIIICVFSILQYFYLSEKFMLRFEQTRNLMGSFIGHNTGLSSYLMVSFFLSVAALSFIKGKTLRALLILFLIIEGFIFVAAQSRAVILILFFLTPFYLWHLRKTTGMRLRFKWFIAAIAALSLMALVQMIDVSWNPFYSRRAPLVRRLRAFQPKNLKGTRLRILVCSQSLLEEAPLFGHGFNSFQYVYPKAQADYLAEYEDTILYPTDLRSDRAHNDYLQIAIELGFIGLGFGLLILFLFLKRGQRSIAEIRDPVRKRLLCAIFFSLTAYLLHAFVDFPMQIPPLAYLFLFLLGIWVSGKDAWKDESTSFDFGAQPPGFFFAAKKFGRPLFILLLFLFLFFMTIGNRLILHLFRSDILFFKSDMYLKTFQQYPNITEQEKMDLLNRSVAIAQRANRLDPLNAELRFKLGETYYFLGRFCIDQWNSAKKAGDADMEMSWKYAAQRNLLRSLNKLEHALEEFRFHAVYFMIGYVEELLDKVDPNKGHVNRARENYSLAVRYSPSFAMGLKNYSELLIRMSRNLPDVQKREIALEILRLRRLIVKYQPEYFHEHYVEKALTATMQEDYEKAANLFEEIIRIQPKNALYYSLLAQTLVKNNQYDRALGVLSQALKIAPDSTDVMTGFAIAHLRKKDFEKALYYIRKNLEMKESEDDIFETLEALTLEAMGRNEEARNLLAVLEKKAEKNPRYLQTLGTLYIDYFDDYEKGIPYLERCLERLPNPVGEAYYLLAQDRIKKGDIKTAKDYLEKALQVARNFVKAERLLKELQDSKGTDQK